MYKELREDAGESDPSYDAGHGSSILVYISHVLYMVEIVMPPKRAPEVLVVR